MQLQVQLVQPVRWVVLVRVARRRRRRLVRQRQPQVRGMALVPDPDPQAKDWGQMYREMLVWARFEKEVRTDGGGHEGH